MKNVPIATAPVIHTNTKLNRLLVEIGAVCCGLVGVDNEVGLEAVAVSKGCDTSG